MRFESQRRNDFPNLIDLDDEWKNTGTLVVLVR